jgi:hypothetical protein
LTPLSRPPRCLAAAPRERKKQEKEDARRKIVEEEEAKKVRGERRGWRLEGRGGRGSAV